MAFPASVQIQAESLERLRNAALDMRRNALRHRDAMAAGNVSAATVVTALNNLRAAIEVLDGVAAVPGIEQYAQGQYDDPTLDLVAEYNAMRTAAVGARDWIIANLPTDQSGYLLLQTMDASGLLVWREFTPADTAGLRTELTAVANQVA